MEEYQLPKLKEGKAKVTVSPMYISNDSLRLEITFQINDFIVVRKQEWVSVEDDFSLAFDIPLEVTITD